MYSRSQQFYGIWYTFVRIKLFIWPSLWHNYNTSIKKFLGDMDWSMVHIFVTANFSGKCLLMGATFNF
jgi:hypothetical protein